MESTGRPAAHGTVTTMIRTRNFLALPLIVAAVFALLFLQPANAQELDPTYTVVRHILTATEDGSVTVEEETVVAQFAVNANTWAPISMPVSVQYNGAGEIPGGHNLPGIIQGALATWNSVTPTTFSFTYEGATSSNPGGCASPITLDGTNTIQFMALQGATLGITCAVYLTGADTKLVEFDMQLSNNAAIWSSAAVTPANQYDLPTTILHELGHAAGLAHSDDEGSAMNPTLALGTQRRSLSADDIAGLKTAYPVSAVAGVTNPGTAPAITSPAPIIRGQYRVQAAFVAQD